MGIKTSLGLLILVAVLLGLARSDMRLGPVAKPKVQVSFWNGFTGPDGRTMLQLIRRFNEANPDVQVSMQRMDWATYYNKLMVAAVDGRGPAMFVIHAGTLPRMHRAGFVANLANMLDESSGIPPSDFDPYVLDQVRYGEEVAGIPLDIHPQGLYCNKDMLERAGLPGPPRNGEEFLRAAKAMKRDLDGDGHPDIWGFALTMWRNNFQCLVPQFGGRYLDENGDADLDNPANVRALDFLGTLTKKGLVPPPENGLGWVGFRQKKVAMVWDGVYMLGDLKRLGDLPYVGAPIPQIGPRPGTTADSHILCVKKDLPPKEREASERFYRFLSANSIGWADAGQVPGRLSVRRTPQFQAMEVQSAFAKQIPYMMYPAKTPVLFELTLEIDLAVEKVMRGRASAAEALRVADVNSQRFIDRDRRERGNQK